MTIAIHMPGYERVIVIFRARLTAAMGDIVIKKQKKLKINHCNVISSALTTNSN